MTDTGAVQARIDELLLREELAQWRHSLAIPPSTSATGHLAGKTENRQDLVDTFQAPSGPPVFLLSLKAAGSGLNLTAASYVVLYDP